MAKAEISLIKEGKGLGDLTFGMTSKEAEALLGEAKEKEQHADVDDANELTENWHYDELELSLGFDKEDEWRLSALAITSADYKFRDFNPIGLTKLELTNKLKDSPIDDLEHEDWSTAESPNTELISSECLGINFWFDEDRLCEVQWVPLYN